MSDQFLAEIRIFAGNYAPRSWAFCNGQLLSIANNTALASLIGVTYGGDGRSTMALPNLEGRSPMHPGRGPGLSSKRLGQTTGAQNVTLTEAQIPRHYHFVGVDGSGAGDHAPSTTTFLANSRSGSAYQANTTSNLVNTADETISNTGENQPHQNMQPYLTLNFIIAMTGLYPSRS